MKIKLHEIELGAADLQSGTSFFQSVLGLSLTIDQPGLKVFDPGVPSLDLNLSNHLSQGNVMLSFICDDLNEMIKSLRQHNINFEGPVSSHLGMTSISFSDPYGYTIRINQASADSPEWLRKQI